MTRKTKKPKWPKCQNGHFCQICQNGLKGQRDQIGLKDQNIQKHQNGQKSQNGQDDRS